MKKVLIVIGCIVFFKIFFYFTSGRAMQSVAPTPRAQVSEARAPQVRQPVPPDFRRWELLNGVGLDVPEGWVELSSKQIDQIRQAADYSSVGGEDPTPEKDTVLALVAHADPNINKANIRVSFINKEFTEEDVRAVTAPEIAQMCEQSKNPVMISEPACSVEELGGVAAVHFRYLRMQNATGQPWVVEIYSVPLKDTNAIFTFSHQESDRFARAALRNVKNTVYFQQ